MTPFERSYVSSVSISTLGNSAAANRILMLVRLITLCLILALAAPGGSAQSPSAAANDLSSVPPDLMFTLSRDGLRIKIVADGTVVVEGVAFEFDLARIKMKLSAGEVKNLLRAFERINYFSLNDRYFDKADGCRGTRASYTFIAITTSLTLNGKSKSVTRLPHICLEEDGTPYPRELVAVEKLIEQTVDLKRR